MCPGCGQPRTKALWVDGETRARWAAGYQECGACYELAKQQEAQRLKDAKVQHAMSKPHEKTPWLAPHLITAHRHWLVQPAD